MYKHLLLLLALAVPLPAALAQDAAPYPSRAVTLVVPYPASGPMDKLARELAEPLRRELRQPVVIQNLSGAGGNLGSAIALRAAPDGYTILMNHISMATGPALYRHLGFNPVTDFEPLGIVAESPLALVARPQVTAGSVTELVRWIAKAPQVKLANGGIGSASHLCGLLVQSSLRLDMTTVPYRGTAPAVTDLLAGHVDMMCDLTANVLPHVAAGKLKPVGVTSPRPLAGTQLAAVPTLDQFGVRGVQLSIWYGLYAPRGTPAAVLERLNAALMAAARDEGFRRAQQQAGIQVVQDQRSTQAGHRSFLAAELARWTPVIKAAGAYAD